MRTLKIIEHVSLDGVIQNSAEDGFPYPDWTGAYRTPAGAEAMLSAHGERFDLLLGRSTISAGGRRRRWARILSRACGGSRRKTGRGWS